MRSNYWKKDGLKQDGVVLELDCFQEKSFNAIDAWAMGIWQTGATSRIVVNAATDVERRATALRTVWPKKNVVLSVQLRNKKVYTGLAVLIVQVKE